MSNKKSNIYQLKRLNFNANRFLITYRRGHKGPLFKEEYRICADNDEKADFIVSFSKPLDKEKPVDAENPIKMMLHSKEQSKRTIQGKETLIDSFLTHIKNVYQKTGSYDDTIQARRIEVPNLN
jgi:hypothetical protein